MISRIKGILIDKFNGILTVDVSGVGYEIITSPYVSSTLKQDEEVSLIVYTDVRENAITLFGFSSRVEKQSFMLLKKVKGIGSKLALAILSVLRPEELMAAIGNSDTKLLTTVSGVGKKSAERIIVELREAVSEFVQESTLEQFADIHYSSKFSKAIKENFTNLSDKIAIDACLALEKLGFSSDKSQQSIIEALTKSSNSISTSGDLVRVSLSLMR